MNLDPVLLKIFEGEQQEHVARLRALLDAGSGGAVLSARPEAEEALRRAHTLKGAARAVGVGPTELLAHGMEAVFARMRDGALAPGEAAIGALCRALDATEDVLACVIADRPLPDTSKVLREIENLLSGSSAAQVVPSQAAAARGPSPLAGQRTDMVRVVTSSIDDLVRSSSQVLFAANREAGAAREMSALAERMAALQGEWTRGRQRIAAQLERAASEARLEPVFECLNSMQSEIDSLVAKARAASASRRSSSWNLQQLASELHRSACRVRMTPAESVLGSFGTMVRELAHEEGKQVEFRAEGLDVLADRLVLQALKDPVMHLLRNAVAHGIESPAKRTAAGKPPAGMVRLRLEARGDRLGVTVEDDGAGLNAESISRTAVLRGLIPEAAAAVSREDLVKLILQPGFSTAASVTKLAGRGMGMAVVYAEVTRLQGELTIGQPNGAGMLIALSVPLSVSTQQLLLVACNGQVFGIPCWALERLHRVGLGEIESVEGAEAIKTELGPVPLARLSDLLEIRPAAGSAAAEPGTFRSAGSGALAAADSEVESEPKISVAVLESGGQRAGIIVDSFLDQRETLVNDLGLDAAAAGMANGGVALEDGTVAVVLNPVLLIEKFRRSGKLPGLKRTGPEAPTKIPSILVVDDSITTRSLEKSMLEAHGYRVRVAVDGIEALEQLRSEKPDLVITDVMMPRMDGLQLLDRIKHDPDLARIPVIMVTSLEKSEDQQRGLSLGADAYIVKQKFNQRELLNIIRQIL